MAVKTSELVYTFLDGKSFAQYPSIEIRRYSQQSICYVIPEKTEKKVLMSNHCSD